MNREELIDRITASLIRGRRPRGLKYGEMRRYKVETFDLSRSGTSVYKGSRTVNARTPEDAVRKAGARIRGRWDSSREVRPGFWQFVQQDVIEVEVTQLD